MKLSPTFTTQKKFPVFDKHHKCECETASPVRLTQANMLNYHEVNVRMSELKLCRSNCVCRELTWLLTWSMCFRVWMGKQLLFSLLVQVRRPLPQVELLWLLAVAQTEAPNLRHEPIFWPGDCYLHHPQHHVHGHADLSNDDISWLNSGKCKSG